MKYILLGAAVVGMLAVSTPTEVEAQNFRTARIPTFSYLPQREAAFRTFSPLTQGGDIIPDNSQPAIRLLNRVVFGASGVSQVSRFFGIRQR